MDTVQPTYDRASEAAEAWWSTLSDQERIIVALAVEPPSHHPCDVAEKPWKWIQEAYELAQDNAR